MAVTNAETKVTQLLLILHFGACGSALVEANRACFASSRVPPVQRKVAEEHRAKNAKLLNAIFDPGDVEQGPQFSVSCAALHFPVVTTHVDCTLPEPSFFRERTH